LQPAGRTAPQRSGYPTLNFHSAYIPKLDVKVDESLLILDRLYGVNLRIANAGLDVPVNR
jgi:hypothetical protein